MKDEKEQTASAPLLTPSTEPAETRQLSKPESNPRELEALAQNNDWLSKEPIHF